MNKCHYFTGPYGQPCPETRPTDGSWIFGFTMVLPELVRLLAWTSANILPALDSSGKISSQGCLAMTRTILSQDSANWWKHAFCCEFSSISTNANHYLKMSQSLTVTWLIFGSSSTSNFSLATGPVLSRDLFYAWASPEYRDSLTSAGLRVRRLSKISIQLAFLHGRLSIFAKSECSATPLWLKTTPCSRWPTIQQQPLEPEIHNQFQNSY